MATVEGDGGRGGDRARPSTGRAAACDAASGVPQVTTTTRLPGEGPFPSMVQTESLGLRPATDGREGFMAPEMTAESQATVFSSINSGGVQQFDDKDIEKMKIYIYELERKIAELREKLEAAEAILKEGNKFIHPNPLIGAELDKCHDVFLCAEESGYKKLSEFLADSQSKLTMDVKVHGRQVIKALKQFENDLKLYIPPGARTAREKPKKFRRMTTLAKYVILGIIEDIYRFHRHGLSLDGRFTLANFYWTHLKKIKLDPALKLVICRRDRDKMINDYHQIYTIILEILSIHEGNFPIPADLQSFLDLLNCDDPIKYQHIIRYNMSLMSEIGKKCHYITLYDRLQQLIREDQQQKDEQRSVIVLQFIFSHFENPSGIRKWSTMAQDNLYVQAVYKLRCQNLGKEPLTEPLDLLAVWRNGLTHILDGSVKGGAPLFKDEDLVDILESTIPGVFNGLQTAMNEVGLLELPHLMKTMRM